MHWKKILSVLCVVKEAKNINISERNEIIHPTVALKI